jgi:thymidylate synthase, flavin-dependent
MEVFMKVKIIAHTPNPEEVVASAAKLCYSKVGVDEIQENLTEEGIEKFVSMLSAIGHHSPLEHCTFTFAVEGISRACSHQLVRHRIASYSQQSQRYVKLDKFDYIIPTAIENNEFAKDIFLNAMEQDQKAYNGIVEELMNEYIASSGYTLASIPRSEYNKLEKLAIEDARYVFPNACETKIVFTMNVRTLMNFFTHRCCDRAQWEIRDLANEMLIQVKEIAPTLFKKAGASCVRGKCPEGSMSCGNPKKD